MNTYLVLFTIGPVQTFIAQARKTQDLFAGSRLLSELSRKAFERLTEKINAQKGNIELIFPAFYDEKGVPVPSNPNRFAAKISNIRHNDLKVICREVKQEVIEIDYKAKGIELLSKFGDYGKITAKVNGQLDNLWEIFWGAVPITEKDFLDQYQALESHLGSLKNIRPFQQTEEKGRKCNVDGIRNALFVRNKTAKGAVSGTEPAFLDKPVCKIPLSDNRLSPGEGLSAVSMYKRLYRKEENFPSTAQIALMEKLARIRENDAHYQYLKEYSDPYHKNWDEQLLFRENLNEKYFIRQGIDLDSGECLERYENLSKNVGDFTPSYYALLVFDGDKMGEWLGGKYLEDPMKLENFQSRLKNNLRQFATNATNFLNNGNRKGRAVYAGGDDFLGFVNLHHLLTTLKELRALFQEYVNDPLHEVNEGFQIKPGFKLTFSAGIAIAHYKEPLSLVLGEAREAEKEAKKIGPDHFSLSVLRHSGGTTTFTLPFFDGEKKLLDSLANIVEQLSNGNFSNKFIHSLIKETRFWSGADPRELFDIEVLRLVRRACNLQRDERESVGEYQTRKNILITDLIRSVLSLNVNSKSSVISEAVLSNTGSALRVCDFIHRTTKAEPDEKHI